MSWTFNPFTGELDKVGVSTAGSSATPHKVTKVVDSAFLTTPDIALPAAPLTDGETVKLNGLDIDQTNYSITGTTLTMITTQLRVGDKLYIDFIS